MKDFQKITAAAVAVAVAAVAAVADDSVLDCATDLSVVGNLP